MLDEWVVGDRNGQTFSECDPYVWRAGALVPQVAPVRLASIGR
jgi:hypothetical protein